MNNDNGSRYTKLPNSVMEWLYGSGCDLTMREIKVLLCVFRHTYGFGRESAMLSSRFVADATGIDQAHVVRTLNALISKGLLAKLEGRKIGVYSLVKKAYKNQSDRHSTDALSASDAGDALSASEPMLFRHLRNKRKKETVPLAEELPSEDDARGAFGHVARQACEVAAADQAALEEHEARFEAECAALLAAEDAEPLPLNRVKKAVEIADWVF